MWFSVLAIFGVYVLGLWWCYEVIARFRDDVKELREVKDFTRRAAIIIVWCMTIIIAIVLVGFTLGMAAKAVLELRAW
jgi:uncharacterized membrane protein SpoIIM required for sporulation